MGTTPSGTPSCRCSRSSSTRIPRYWLFSKLNKLNQAVEGEAAAVISMFEFDEESYELAKMALINEYGDPALCANKMLRDIQNLDRVKGNDIEGLRNLHIRGQTAGAPPSTIVSHNSGSTYSYFFHHREQDESRMSVQVGG